MGSGEGLGWWNQTDYARGSVTIDTNGCCIVMVEQRRLVGPITRCTWVGCPHLFYRSKKNLVYTLFNVKVAQVSSNLFSTQKCFEPLDSKHFSTQK